MTTALEGLPGLDEPVAAPFPFRHWTDLLNRPRPRWLVDGFLPAAAVVWLYGDPGSGKSFIAFDLAVAIAGDLDEWHGHPIAAAGPVRILLGEGHAGAPERLAAAILSRSLPNPDAVDIAILETPPNLLDPLAMARLSAQLQAEPEPPVLVVIDTWNATAHGAEGAHSDTGSVGTACAGLAALARDTGATVLVIDHPNKTDKNSPAGNFAKSAAADAMWSVKAEPDTGHSVVSCTKLKDAPIARGEIRFERVALRKGEEGSPAYLRLVGDLVSLDDLKNHEGLTLRALKDVSSGNGASDREWKEVSMESGVTRPTYYRMKARLQRHKLVEQKGNRFHLTAGGEALVSTGLTEVSP